MTTPTADKLRIYFASKYLSADDDAITQQTADAGGSVSTIVDAALTQANDYWNGAVGWFDGDTTTVALQGVFFHVRDFDAATDTLTLAKNLPAAPAAGDTYRLVLGGNWRSSQECFGMTAGGDLPELVAVTGSNITGLTLKKCSALLGAGTLTVFYDQSEDELKIKMTGDADYGAALDVSGNVTDGIVFCEDGQSWLQVDTVAASLPVGDQTDTWTLAYPERTFSPDYEGYEGSAGKTRYRLAVVKNTDGAETMVGLAVYAAVPAGTATTVGAGESLGTVEGSFAATDASDWPAASFWIKNTTVDDCRYVKYRSGNTLYCAAAGAGLRGFTAGAWSEADAIEVMPEIDLGKDAPSTLQFENPATEETAPSGITFSDYASDIDALAITDLATGTTYGVWIREVIMPSHRAKADAIDDLYFNWS